MLSRGGGEWCGESCLEEGFDTCWFVELSQKGVNWYPDVIHTVTSESWTPGNETERAIAEHKVNRVQAEALRKLVPDSGAYLKEV